MRCFFRYPRLYNYGKDGLSEPDYQIARDETGAILHIDLPGVLAEDIDVSVKDQVLHVQAHRLYEKNKQNIAVDFDVSGVDVERITTNLALGVLCIRLPTTLKNSGRSIPVTNGDLHT